jgi:integrase
MAARNFLFPRKNGTYVFRRRYPRDLAGHFSKPFRWILLDTHNVTVAKDLAREKAVEFDREMARLRIEAGLAKGRELREADIPALASRFAASALHTDEMERDAGLSESEWEEQGALIETALRGGKKALARGDAGYIEESVNDLLERECYGAPAGPLLRTLCLAVLKSDIGVLTDLSKRQQGDVVATPPMPAEPGVYAGIGLHGEAGYFEHVIKTWQAGVHAGPKTLYEAEAALAGFVALCGGNTRVIPWSGKKERKHPGAETLPRLHLLDITREHAMRFKRHLLEKKNSIRTAKKKLGLLCAMVSLVLHEHKHDLSLPRNPFRDLWSKQELKDRGRPKPRINFSVEQLQRIFNSPVYTKPGHLASLCASAGGAAAYWLWLVATFSGARLEELGQLTGEDFVKSNGRYIFSVRCGKSASARRIVPVHRILEELGFVDYALHHRGRLFPDLLPDNKGALTGNFSKWANGYLDKVVCIADVRLTFHSTRHTVKHFLRAAGVYKEINDYIAGHSLHDVGDDYGGESYPIPPLIEAIDKLVYEGLDLSHLKRWTPKGEK